MADIINPQISLIAFMIDSYAVDAVRSSIRANLTAVWHRGLLYCSVYLYRNELNGHATELVPGISFMIGLRVAGPALISWSGMSPWRLFRTQPNGSSVLGGTHRGAGFVFGETLSLLVADLGSIEDWILLCLLATGIVMGMAAMQGERSIG